MLKIGVYFNIAVLIVLAFTVVHLIFRPLERAFEHNRSVIVLSGFIRDLDDYIQPDRFSQSEINLLLPQINARYKVILDLMPKHSDKNFLKAKANLQKKEING
jgi:hypothetical protein